MKFVIKKEYDSGEIDCLVDDIIVGYITYKINKKSVWLYKIKVEKEYRNKGIGKKLIKIFENEVYSSLRNVIEGRYFPEDEENIVVKTFYESNGYSISREGFDIEIFKYVNKKHDLSDLDIEYYNIRSR